MFPRKQKAGPGRPQAGGDVALDNRAQLADHFLIDESGTGDPFCMIPFSGFALDFKGGTHALVFSSSCLCHVRFLSVGPAQAAGPCLS